MNSIPLSRFKHVGKVQTLKQNDIGNGNVQTVPIDKFSFIYCQINERLNAKLSNLGTSQDSNILIATLDPRFENYLNKQSVTDKIVIKSNTYFIANVSKDDSHIDPMFEITLTKSKANSVGEN